MIKKIELLAPAGNFECLKAAINNGCNAVYLGGKNFSARAFANNFSNEELIEAVRYAHLRNVKVYITVNILLNEKEIENVKSQIDFYYKNNVDALLIQDLGLYYYIKNTYPDFELHCSTQMHVHNLKGIEVCKKLGFKRVVIPRESDLEFISKATKLGIEIETFVHGAICVSYSGQCLMSSVTKNRSANKGICSQCCRLKYDIFDENNNKLAIDSEYPLSTKDMNLINRVPELIEAGVASLKIEGRMKSSAYVGYVTSLYRKAIDSYYKKEKYLISEQELDNLKVLFNRNFTDCYLDNQNKLFGQKTPNHQGIEIGKTIGYKNNNLYIKLTKDLSQFDGIRIQDFGCIVNYLYKDGLLVNKAKRGDIVSIKSDNINGIVYKTQDYELEDKINRYDLLRFPLDLKIEVFSDKPVTIEAKLNHIIFHYESKYIVEKAKNSPISNENIEKQFKKCKETCYFINLIDIKTANSFINISILNEIRRDFFNSLNNYCLNLFKREQILSQIDYKTIENDQNIDPIGVSIDDNYVINPYDVPVKDITYQIGDLLDQDKNIIFYSMNCSNSYCYEFYKKLGYKSIILSSELKENEIIDLIDQFSKRNGLICNPYVYKDGARVLMYCKNSIIDNHKYPIGVYTLRDGQHQFKIKRNHDTVEIREDKQNTLLLTPFKNI